MSIFKTKTLWVGVLTVLAGLIEGAFDGDWGAGVEKILLGIAMITGRHAIAKTQQTDIG